MGNVKGKAFVPFFILLLMLSAVTLPAQEQVLHSYQQSFIRSDLLSKAEVLQDAALDEYAASFIGQLYHFALDFVVRNAELIKDDPDMISLTVIATRGVKKSGYSQSVPLLWDIFQTFADSLVQIETLDAMAELGFGNKQLCESLNSYLAEQNSKRRVHMPVDFAVVHAVIRSLARLGDASSFPPLFAVMTLDYSPIIREEAARSLDSLPGDYRQFLLGIIHNNPPEEKLIAFRAGAGNRRLSPAEQGQIAEAALEKGLLYTQANESDAKLLFRLCSESSSKIAELKWNHASPLVIRYFYLLLNEYLRGTVPIEHFIEVIDCLAEMGSVEAAQAVAMQLGLINAELKKNGLYNEQVVLALIGALGNLGDKSAFDQLLAISYLPYGEKIQAAAKAALDRLQW